MGYSCRKCGCTQFYKVTKGTQIGLYCAKCNAWLKWVSKTEAFSFPQHIENDISNYNRPMETNVKVTLTFDRVSVLTALNLPLTASDAEIKEHLRDVLSPLGVR